MDDFQPQLNLPLSAIGALALGQRAQAIKIVRAETSLDLNAAQALVEAYERQHPDICPAPATKPSSASPWLWLSVAVMAVGSVAWLFMCPY